MKVYFGVKSALDFEVGDERGEQVGGLVDVVERDHLDRAVHVAVGNADQSRRDAGAGELDGVGVGAGAAADGFPLADDVGRVGRGAQPLDDDAGSCSARGR